MLNIQPKNIIGIIQGFEFSVNSINVGLISIVPSTLMISQCKHGRQLLETCQIGILSVDFLRRRAWQEKDINDPRF